MGRGRQVQKFEALCLREALQECSNDKLIAFADGWGRADGAANSEIDLAQLPIDGDDKVIYWYLNGYLLSQYHQEKFDLGERRLLESGFDFEEEWGLPKVIFAWLDLGEKDAALEAYEKLKQHGSMSLLEEGVFLASFGQIDVALSRIRQQFEHRDGRYIQRSHTIERALDMHIDLYLLPDDWNEEAIYTPENIVAMAMLKGGLTDEALKLIGSQQDAKGRDAGLRLVAKMGVWLRGIDKTVELFDRIQTRELRMKAYLDLIWGGPDYRLSDEYFMRVEAIQELVRRDQSVDAVVRAEALMRFGYIYANRGQLGRALAHYYAAKVMPATYSPRRGYRANLQDLPSVIALAAARQGDFSDKWYRLSEHDKEGDRHAQYLYHQAIVEPCQALDRARLVPWYKRSRALAWVSVAIYEREQSTGELLICS